MGGEHAEPLVGRGGAEGAGQRVLQADSGVMRGPEFKLMRALGDPGAVLEDAAEAGHEGGAVHLGGALARDRRMRRGPVLGDLQAGGEPDALVAADIVEKAFQGLRPAGTPDEAAMQADRHHLRRALNALLVEAVEAVLEIGEILVARVEALRRGEAHVVGVERVGHDQLVACPEARPVGQVVGIGVGGIGEAALFGHQPHGVVGGAARVPAARRLAHHLGVQADRLLHVGALGGLVGILVLDPFQPVAGDLPVGLLHRRDLFGRARQRGGDAVDGDGEVLQHPVQPPEPGPRAVFVDRFHVPVARAGPGCGTDDLGEKRLGGRVAMQDVVLAALFVVQHDLQRDLRAAGPFRVGGLGAMADHVAGVAGHGGLLLCAQPIAAVRRGSCEII